MGAMGKRGRPPKHQPSAAPSFLWARPLDPYLCFVGAFLRQVVLDAHSDREEVQRDAQAFLLDEHRLAPWIELTGADIDKLQGALLRTAGLARGDHGTADAAHDFAD